MTIGQEENLGFIKSHFIYLVDEKYRKGDLEHGGELVDLEVSLLLEFAIDEAIDQVVYLLTLKRKLRGSSSAPTREV